MAYTDDDVRVFPGRANRGTGRGADHRNAKLTEDQVREIKRELRLPAEQRRSLTKIAEAYGVKRGTIDHIHRGNNWSHVRVEEDE